MKKLLIILSSLIWIFASSMTAQSRQDVIATIPFEFENNRIRLTVDMDGAQLKVLLDSGASTSVLFDDEIFASIPSTSKVPRFFSRHLMKKCLASSCSRSL